MHSEDILNRWGFKNITDKNIFSTDYVICNVFKVFFFATRIELRLRGQLLWLMSCFYAIS